MIALRLDESLHPYRASSRKILDVIIHSVLEIPYRIILERPDRTVESCSSPGILCMTDGTSP